MADVVDDSDEKAAKILEADIQQIRNKAKIDPGVPGECEKCGDDWPRLIRGCCARCRDKYKLP